MADRSISRQAVPLVDDGSAITDTPAPYLERSSFSIVAAHDGAKSLDVYEKIKPDIVITDVMMPQLGRRQLAREICARGGWTPIILLTRIDQSYGRPMALDEGADDHLSKSFDPQELASRIHAALRRTATALKPYSAADRLVYGNLALDQVALRVFLKAHEVALTPKASMPLDYLMTHSDELHTRERLLAALWGINFAFSTHAVDHRIRKIRRVLGDDPTQPTYIETVPSVGYRFIEAVRI